MLHAVQRLPCIWVGKQLRLLARNYVSQGSHLLFKNLQVEHSGCDGVDVVYRCMVLRAHVERMCSSLWQCS